MGSLKNKYFILICTSILVLFFTCYTMLELELHSFSNGISLSLMFNPSAVSESSLFTSSISNSSDLSEQTELFSKHMSRVFAVNNANHQTNEYTRLSPSVWIGGVPSSGTTLMRVILGTHPSLRCGPETALIPSVLDLHDRLKASSADIAFIRGAGMSDRVINSALSSYILDLLTKYIEPSDVLCSKDPVVLNHGVYINELFPNSKHIFMIRDGRAVVNSIITRKHKIHSFQNLAITFRFDVIICVYLV